LIESNKQSVQRISYQDLGIIYDTLKRYKERQGTVFADESDSNIAPRLMARLNQIWGQSTTNTKKLNSTLTQQNQTNRQIINFIQPNIIELEKALEANREEFINRFFVASLTLNNEIIEQLKSYARGTYESMANRNNSDDATALTNTKKEIHDSESSPIKKINDYLKKFNFKYQLKVEYAHVVRVNEL